MCLCGMTVLAGCQKESVADVIQKDEENPRMVYEELTKDLSDITPKEVLTGTDSSGDEKPIDIGNVQVTPVRKGQTCNYGGYDITILNAKKIDKTLMQLNDITGSNQFRDFLFKQYHYSPYTGNTYDGPSETEELYPDRGVQFYCIQLKIKNVAAIESDICLSPSFFNRDGEKEFTMIRTGAESIGYDKYSNLDLPDIPHKDGLFYSFKKGEELITNVVVMLPAASGVVRNLYMSTDFLYLGNGQAVNGIPNGSYLMEVGVVDEQYNKYR